MALITDQITAPIREFARLAGIGESTAWEMVRGGTVQTISIGKRRLVVLASYRQYVEAQLAEPPKDARRNRTVPSLGSTKQQLAPADLTLRVDARTTWAPSRDASSAATATAATRTDRA